MCHQNSSCLCHLIKPAIENDKKGQFKIFFDKTFNDDFYLFLEDSYQLLKQKDDNAFRSSLSNLINKYLHAGEYQINLPAVNKKEFMDHYDLYAEGEGDKNTMSEALGLIIKYSEKLCFMNLITETGFKDCLDRYQLKDADTMNNNEVHSKQSKCCVIN